MAPAVTPAELFAELRDCALFGGVLAAGYLALFLADKHRGWKDITVCLAAAALLQSYAANRSAAGVPRWYLWAGFLAGYAPPVLLLGEKTRRLGLRLRRKITAPARRLAQREKQRRTAEKKMKKPEKKRKKKLQSTGEMLYNSII